MTSNSVQLKRNYYGRGEERREEGRGKGAGVRRHGIRNRREN